MKKTLLKMIPKSVLDLIEFKPFKTFRDYRRGLAKISYSQQSEDLHILRHFSKKWGGLYIDVGAFHPFKYSNTHIFYKMGWRGINIEPNPDQFSFFAKYRPEDINLNIGISSKIQELTYYSFNNGAVNTFNEEHAKKWESEPGFNIISKKKVQTTTIENVLDKHLKARQSIDFMSVDVEGLDLEVIRSNNWERFRPKLVLVETAEIYSVGKIHEIEIISFMKSVEYKLWTITGITLIFIDERSESS